MDVQAQPAPPRPAGKKKGSRGLLIGIAIATLLIAGLAIGAVIAIPRIVASKVATVAEHRALAIQYGGSGFGFSQVTLTDVAIHPKSSELVKMTAPEMAVDLSWLSPTGVRFPKLDVAITGSLRDVNASLDEVRAADLQLPEAERLPVDVAAGTVDWKDPFGRKTHAKFGTMIVAVRPAAGTLEVTLHGGSIDTPYASIAPVDAKLTRSKDSTTLHGTASPEGTEAATLDVTSDGDGDTASLSFDKLKLIDVGDLPGLDLSKTVVDGTASYARTSEGAVKSSGKITVAHVSLPPMKIGIVQISLGGSIKYAWKATPKKGKPGTMTITEGQIETDIRGKTRVITIGGEVSVGPDGQGPIVLRLTWSTETIPCSEIVASVGGGLASNFVGGTVHASGTFTADLADLASTRFGYDLQQSCAIDPGIGGLDVGGLLQALPK